MRGLQSLQKQRPATNSRAKRVEDIDFPRVDRLLKGWWEREDAERRGEEPEEGGALRGSDRHKIKLSESKIPVEGEGEDEPIEVSGDTNEGLLRGGRGRL
jgi:hypothetical protein